MRWVALAGAAAFFEAGSASELWDAPMSGVVNAVKPMVATTRLEKPVSSRLLPNVAVKHEGGETDRQAAPT